MSSYFVSDLHLDDHQPQRTQAFLYWLNSIKDNASNLYILGDLFEVWIGDDGANELEKKVCSELARVAATGCKVQIMCGNRDFLYGQEFCQQTRCTLLAEEHLINTAFGSCLLLHGDTLCLEDKEYLKVRAQLRNPEWQRQFLQQTIAQRRAFAADARAKSAQHTSAQSNEIMDVTTAAVENKLLKQRVKLVIHGHTHRPMLHQHQNGQRLVLGDWDKNAWFIRLQDDTISLNRFSVADAAKQLFKPELVHELKAH